MMSWHRSVAKTIWTIQLLHSNKCFIFLFLKAESIYTRPSLLAACGMRVTCDFGLRTRRDEEWRGVTKLDGIAGNPAAAGSVAWRGSGSHRTVARAEQVTVRVGRHQARWHHGEPGSRRSKGRAEQLAVSCFLKVTCFS
jgi:hypothetical protein